METSVLYGEEEECGESQNRDKAGNVTRVPGNDAK